MDEMKKDTNLLNGKGEVEEVYWITVNGAHVPIEKGENKKEAIAKHFKSKEEQRAHLDEQIEQLLKWQRKIPDNVLRSEIRLPKEVKKELANKIRNFEPITLDINGRKIIAKFDKHTANKNIYDYEHNNSSVDGFNYKMTHIDEIPQVIKSSHYDHSAPSREESKNKPAHIGVVEWHYFKTQIKTKHQVFDVTVNIRDKGNEQFVYEISYA